MEDYFIIKVGENEKNIIKMLTSSSIWYTIIELEKEKYFLIKAKKNIVKLFVQFEDAIVLNEKLLKELFNSKRKCNLQNYSNFTRSTKRV